MQSVLLFRNEGFTNNEKRGLYEAARRILSLKFRGSLCRGKFRGSKGSRKISSNVHHMSTRQKAQSLPEASAEKRSRTPSPSHSTSSHKSSSSTSSPSKGKEDTQPIDEVLEEDPPAEEPVRSEGSLSNPSYEGYFIKLLLTFLRNQQRLHRRPSTCLHRT